MKKKSTNLLKPLLQVKNFSYHFASNPGVYAVKNANFSLFPNEFIGIIGESGSGKSVIAKSILQLNSFGGTASKEAKIIYGGVNLLSLNQQEIRKIRGREIGIVFQDPMTYLNPTATIGNQIEESLKLHFPHYTCLETYNKTLELLKLVELPNTDSFYKKYPHELSGGMRQRVMIAISLAPKPRIFIADEITTALDVTVGAEILLLLKKLQKTLAMSIIFISHNLGIIYNFASKILVMYKGVLVEKGETEQICMHPKHPYTKALIDSILKIDMDKNTRFETISVKREISPTGCIFYDRCKYAQEICKKNMPIATTKEDGEVLCYFPLKIKKEEPCQTAPY
jgi:oligopeptide/dipeptide ABC transporter ATP-binding protein